MWLCPTIQHLLYCGRFLRYQVFTPNTSSRISLALKSDVVCQWYGWYSSIFPCWTGHIKLEHIFLVDCKEKTLGIKIILQFLSFSQSDWIVYGYPIYHALLLLIQRLNMLVISCCTRGSISVLKKLTGGALMPAFRDSGHANKCNTMTLNSTLLTSPTNDLHFF